MIGGEFVASGNTGGSGIGPERALEAINKPPRAQRESVSFFELPCERKSGPAESTPGSHPIRRSHPNPQRSFPIDRGAAGGDH